MTRHQDREGRTKRTLICLFLLVAYVVLDVLVIKQPLYDFTIPYQLELRKTYGQSKKFNVAIEIIAQLADKYGMVALYPLAFFSLPLDKSVSLVCAQQLGLGINIMLKFLFLDPRPFMTTEGLVPSKCLFDYGNPSGHSQHSIVIFFGFYTQYIRTYKDVSIFKKNLMLLVAILLFFAVAFSRIATGSHTLNQILHGWVWGAAKLYLFIFNY